jgi:molybdopterin adenylyltransferase
VSGGSKDRPGSPAVAEHRAAAPDVVGFAGLTVSDSRGLGDDRSGDLLRRKVEAAGHRWVARDLVPDEPEEIRRAARDLLGRDGVEVLLVTGGTGLAPRDVTLEALAPLFDRQIPGFGELFRMLSWEQVGSAAMLSRAAAGLVGRQALFCLPGSPKAVALALDELILPEAGHLMGVAGWRRGEPGAGATSSE